MKYVARCASIALVCILVLGIMGCTQSPNQKELQQPSSFDPTNPVQIELWTYYNGAHQQAFDSLVSEFNETRGKEVGVIVMSSSLGGVNELAAAVTDSALGNVGSEPMPDAFLSYSDTALVIDEMGLVADLSNYLSAEQKAAFIEGFAEEGDIRGDGSFKIYPLCKATETLQINMTDWQEFADATNSSLDELASVEGLVEVSQRYYEWTDDQTVEPDDGQAFVGRDSLANYMLSGSMQLGHEIFTVVDGACTIDLDKATMRTLWDNYYVPLIKGYFSDEGRYRSDAVTTGELICYIGSSSSVVYFPNEVAVDDTTSYSIEFGSLENPVFAEGNPCAPQQGAGCVVVASDEKTEQACVEFLTWFTEDERNIKFSSITGYTPVNKSANHVEVIKEIVEELEETHENYLISLPATLETINSGVYASKPFKGSVQVREILETSLGDKATEDREEIDALIAQGTRRDQAVAAFDTDENFEKWYELLVRDVTALVS